MFAVTWKGKNDGGHEEDSTNEEENNEPCFRSSHLITELEPVSFAIYFNIEKKKKINQEQLWSVSY